jgi:hypothetical protein
MLKTKSRNLEKSFVLGADLTDPGLAELVPRPEVDGLNHLHFCPQCKNWYEHPNASRMTCHQLVELCMPHFIERNWGQSKEEK